MALEGQAALVVGGANGIGLATAQALLREGANVALCDVVREKGEESARALGSQFGSQRCCFFHADVTDDKQMDAAFAATKERFSRLDVVVNSAGICNERDWSLQLDINLKGVVRGTLLGWRHMGTDRGGRGGVVVNIASVVGLGPVAVLPTYSASKHAVVGFSRSCGQQFHVDRTGVRVIAVCPGQTDTQIVQNITLSSSDFNEELDKVKESFPMQEASAVGGEVPRLAQAAASGSVWVIESARPAWEVRFPSYADMRAPA